MASFEERMSSLAGAEAVKKAKALLKGGALSGVWRTRDGRLCGVFADPEVAGGVECLLRTGDEAQSQCSFCRPGDGFVLCSHAVAMLMYCGRFPMFQERPETAPGYRGGMSYTEFPQLSQRGLKNNALLYLNVLSDSPHAPCRRENLMLSVKMRCGNREFIGNLNNLRQLYFDKSLRVTLKFDDFSLHEQQLIRFLALYGEAENSIVVLDSEMTAEFFHALPGFTRFFRDNRQITVHPERAEPVLISAGNKFAPGLRVNGAVLPFYGARIIMGRAGCWLGKNDEYFFIGGDCENGFLRSFFRSPVQNIEVLGKFPLAVVKGNSLETEKLSAAPVLALENDPEDKSFVLHCEYLYRPGNSALICRASSGGVLLYDGKFFRKDRELESNFENELSLFGCDLSHAPGRAYFRDELHAALFADRMLPQLLQRYPQMLLAASLSSMLNGNAGLRKLELKCSLFQRNADRFVVSYELSGGDCPVDWELCRNNCHERKKFISVSGVLFAVPDELAVFMRASSSMLQHVDPAARTFEVPFCNAGYFNSLASAVPGAAVPEISADTVSERTVVLPDAPPRFEFKGTLRNYQREGVAFCQYLTDRDFNVLLADEMGLGKTVQFLALLASRLRKDDAPALIVCPASLVSNWEREAKKFIPKLRVAAPQGSAARKNCIEKPDSFELLVLSYAAARLSVRELKKINFSYLALDEAQHIKNPGSGNAKNCKALNARHRIVLTGTPLENSPEDLWSVMDFLQPGMLGTLADFRRRYGNIANDSELQRDLALRTAPFVKRRTKKEVASDLPERSDNVLFCNFTPEQRELYEKILAEGREKISGCGNDAKRCGAEIFATLLRLRQVCCHPGLLPDGGGENIVSSKSEMLSELLAQSIDSGHKVLVFSQFTSMLKLLIPELERNNIPFEYLDGATRNRQQRIDNFNNNPDISIFLLSLKAGGTGLNLTSADTVFIYDPWWNPAAELQAADRTHRIGQTRPVSINKLVMRDSIEEKILALQARKRELFYNLVENPSADGGMSLDELRALLN